MDLSPITQREAGLSQLACGCFIASCGRLGKFFVVENLTNAPENNGDNEDNVEGKNNDDDNFL